MKLGTNWEDNIMLIAKIYVNYDQIDEIWIHNKGECEPEGYCEYRIEKPRGWNNWPITHERKLGYMPLLQEALTILETYPPSIQNDENKGEKNEK